MKPDPQIQAPSLALGDSIGSVGTPGHALSHEASLELRATPGLPPLSSLNRKCVMHRTVGPPNQRGGHGSQGRGSGFPPMAGHPGGDCSSVPGAPVDVDGTVEDCDCPRTACGTSTSARARKLTTAATCRI